MIDAIVLAAGRSQRMGTQKLLLPFAGQTVIGHIVDQLRVSPIRQVYVVVAAESNEVACALSQKRTSLVVNPQPNAEMLSSVRAGLQALPTDSMAAMIVLGDQPSLRCEVVCELVAAFQASGKGIAAPIYSGKRGHPVLIGSGYFRELLEQYDDVGLRGLLAAHAGDIADVPAADNRVLADMDFPDDYQRELRRYNAGKSHD
jgi:CTP:molybdopterin cytidylyltransferase MocA